MLARFKILLTLAVLTAVALLAALLAIRGGSLVAPSGNAPAAPEFKGIVKWLNGPPLSLQQLRGKVVLIDFWTYSCINCIDTLPYVTKWYRQYGSQGLAVIGVHTPEYPFEREPDNVSAAVRRFNIQYPVALDNGYDTWNAFNNEYWPAIYLFDKQGRMVYSHVGEGDYMQTEAKIRELLTQPG